MTKTEQPLVLTRGDQAPVLFKTAILVFVKVCGRAMWKTTSEELKGPCLRSSSFFSFFRQRNMKVAKKLSEVSNNAWP